MENEISMAHGAGGDAYRELVREVFLPAYGSPELETLGDAAICRVDARAGLAFTTDGFVVRPLFFPGGDLGSLCVSGTVNDLAVSGAVPRYLSVSMIVEAGLPTETLRRLSASIAATARLAGVSVVTGDTKVVERGKADGVYVTTAGVGTLDGKWALPGAAPLPGDAIVCTGHIASHGMAVMAARESLGFEPPIESDAKPLAALARVAFETGVPIHAMRDPTRGGVGATVSEWAAPGVRLIVDEPALPILPQVRSACAILGLEPLFAANEGIFLAAVPANRAHELLHALRAHPDGRSAAIVGEAVAGDGEALLRTELGTLRRVLVPRGELLPRIC